MSGPQLLISLSNSQTTNGTIGAEVFMWSIHPDRIIGDDMIVETDSTGMQYCEARRFVITNAGVKESFDFSMYPPGRWTGDTP